MKMVPFFISVQLSIIIISKNGESNLPTNNQNITIMTEKERIVDAIVWHVNYRLGDKGEMYVINGKLAWVGIQHKNEADLSFLESIGISIPPYYEEKHWFRDKSDFDIFLNNEIFRKVCDDFAVNKHA